MGALRLFVLVAVFLAVHHTFRHAIDELARHKWKLQPAWLVFAGLLYAIGLAPMAWFWHRALASLGQPAPWSATLRAYFLGHLGKYVPGKAFTVLLRVAAVRKWVTSIRIAVVSLLLETLTMMAVGAFLAALLSIIALRLEPRFAAISAAMAIAAGIPTLPPVARRLARIGLARLKQEDELGLPASIPADVDASLHGIDLRLLGAGWLAAAVCWTMLGLSQWATLRSIGVETIQPVADLPLMISTVAFAVVAGFLSMLPGGLVVRDALLMQLLAPKCGEANALIAAIVLRLVWLVTEVSVCGILYMAARWEGRTARTPS
jgi:uncharacterized membrane protein YbhN (UPF0104 family)